ncbi:beta-galactosidase [Spirochaetia bacterium]|nr:beta-galactosidase [Spirochaetia bacterium]
MGTADRFCAAFNDGWNFFLGDDPWFAETGFDDRDWKPLVLPHDWGVDYPVSQTAPTGGGGGYAVTGIGWYRKHFTAPKPEPGRRLIIQFDGVFMDSTVFLNGKKLGGHSFGYSEFTLDLTGLTVEGDNVLAVRVNNALQPNSRWYTGSGIYRNVRLISFADVHIDQNGVFILTNGFYNDKTISRLQVQTWVKNDGAVPVDIGVEQHLFDAEGKEVLKDASALHIEAGDRAYSMVLPSLANPHLWTDQDPYLYRLETSLTLDGKPFDTYTTRTGIRTAAFDCDRGFLLNGEQVKIKGVCIHHDGGLTGAASYRETWERRLRLLKDMGCNGIRCAHNPPAPELLDLCDEMGFLVMDEAFDEWLLTKFKSAEYGYSSNFAYGGSQFFAEEGELNLVTMLHRDRNHPSIVLWSIGNEIPEQAAVEGVQILRRLQDICHQEDPTRMVTSALDNIASPEPHRVREEFECALDVVGYNYTGRWGMRAETLYDEDRKKYPGRRMIGSENPSAGGIRGIYEKVSDPNVFRSGYDTATHTHEFLWRYTASRDFVAGDYLWTGIDYLGESRWPLKGAPSGAIDIAGFPKDTFYYFRSIWNDREITLHILPHWNWKGREGEFITVIGYTNCDEVSLYLNGRLVGTKGYDFPNVGMKGAWNTPARKTHPTTHDLHLTWDVPYEAGELRAVGFREGKAVAEELIKTTGAPAKLKVTADREKLPLNGIAHIEIEVLDKAGLRVPNADSLVSVKVEGPAVLLGLDNGDPRDLTEFSIPERKLLAGRLLAVIRGTARGAAPGTARLIVSAKGLEDTVLTFMVG